MNAAEPDDTTSCGADDPAALLARDRQQLRALVMQLRQLLAGAAAEADRSALVGRIGGRLRALAAIEREFLFPHPDAMPADAAQRHQRMAVLSQQLAATDGERAQALDALEHALLAHGASAPSLPDAADRHDLCERIRARRTELLLDEKPD